MTGVFVRVRFWPVLALACAAGLSAAGNGHAQENGGPANRKAIAGAMAEVLMQRQTGAAIPLSELEVQEVDLNFDSNPELYVYRRVAGCSDDSCGNFFFALTGDGFHETLGAAPGARHWGEDTINLGIHKRQTYLDLQVGADTFGWAGDHYQPASAFPRSTLSGEAFLPACEAQTTNETDDAAQVKTLCACQFERFQTIGLPQGDLDRYTRSLKDEVLPGDENGELDAKVQWWDIVNAVPTGCAVEAGTQSWPDAFFTEEQPQAELANLPDFVNACSSQPWMVAADRIGTPDRALAFCGCLARGMASDGADQTQFDNLTRYYRDEINDAELEAIDDATLQFNDNASQNCLNVFPRR